MTRGRSWVQVPTFCVLVGLVTTGVRAADWPQWGGTSARNNAPAGQDIPLDWNIDRGTNIGWTARLGTACNGTPVISGGRVFVGTNNGAGYLSRYPAEIDLGCLLCFDENSGRFLWQYSAEKLPTGKPHDWPGVGLCGTPVVEGERMWLVSNRGEVVCLDTRGFHDGENDGSYQREPVRSDDEADIVWSFNMMEELGVLQHNVANCSATLAGNTLLLGTSNGVDKSHKRVPAPQAPSFLALDKGTGEILWADSSPGENILHGQWSSPAFAELGGAPQAIFAGGDGWVYSFDARGDGNGRSRLLWKCDVNPRQAQWIKGGTGTRNNIIATPVIAGGLVYVATGQSPDYGTGPGRLVCIDPTRTLDGADVSPELAHAADGSLLPTRRDRAVRIDAGEYTTPNPQTAVVWDFVGGRSTADNGLEFTDRFHRTLSSVAIENNLLVVPDIAGVVHCLDARSGERQWSCDLFDEVWASPLIVDEKIYIATTGGRVAIFGQSFDPDVAMTEFDGKLQPIAVIEMGDTIHSTPVVANDVLYIATSSRLYAVTQFTTGQHRADRSNTSVAE